MGYYILIIFAIYYLFILGISYFTGRNHTNNDAFFMGNRKSPWIVVAIGMLGDSISGVTFVSVPGMVRDFNMYYLQLVIGFFLGYLIVSCLLLPLYYKLKLTSIYTYLQQRLGEYSYKTGASFFILSRITGSAAKLYLIILILQSLVLSQWHIPFYLTALVIVLLIWIYTNKSGMKTIVWTDLLQTLFFLIALIFMIYKVSHYLGINVTNIPHFIVQNSHAKIFEFTNWHSPQYFLKQLISGAFIVIVMTGLDQNMMQKNLTCKTLKSAKKNMICYGFGFIPMNLLFLVLGILLLIFANHFNIILPQKSDEILPFLITHYLGLPIFIFFTIGIISSSFCNADSALTSLTTAVCVDLLNIKTDNLITRRSRKIVHIGVCIVFLLLILMIHQLGENNILNTIYILASYTYGPLLGLFTFGLFTKRAIRDQFTPYICIGSPIISYLLSYILDKFGYKVGYEILLVNGALTFIGLWLNSQKQSSKISD